MGDLSTLLLLVVLLGLGGMWLTLSRSRERAMGIARAQCRQYGLQLLDETVGLSGIRFARLSGRWVLERCYSFEVSIDGHDRDTGRLWMVGTTLTAARLPTFSSKLPDRQNEFPEQAKLTDPGAAAPLPTSTDNVLPFRREPRGGNTLH
jgi:hypothetical protein